MNVVITRQEALEGMSVTRAWSGDGGGNSGWMRGCTLGCTLVSRACIIFSLCRGGCVTVFARALRYCREVEVAEREVSGRPVSQTWVSA